MNFLNNALNSIPVVGHLKGFIHQADGDMLDGYSEAADEAFYSANRTTACMGGALFAGPLGSVAAGYVVDRIYKRGNSLALRKIREGNKRDIIEGVADIAINTTFDALGGTKGFVKGATSPFTKGFAKGATKGFAKEATKGFAKEATNLLTKQVATQAVRSSAAAFSSEAVKSGTRTAADAVEKVAEGIENIREHLANRNSQRSLEQNQNSSAPSGRNSEHRSANNSGRSSINNLRISEANNVVQTNTNYDDNGYESSSDDDEVNSTGSESESQEDDSTDSQENNCKALTANGERCENTAREGTSSCGLQAHITQIRNARQRNGKIYIFTLSNGNIKIGQTKRSVTRRLAEETQYPVKMKIKFWNCTDRVRAETKILRALRKAQLRSIRERLIEVFSHDIVTREEAEETIREVVNNINREMTNENYPSEESEYLPDMIVVEDLSDMEEENFSDNDIDRS